MNHSGVRYSEQELRRQLKREKIGDTTLYYSLVKKDGKNLSFFYNYRLLIYDINRRMLYYNNDFKNTPFRTVVPQPKNGQFTPLKYTTFKNPSGTSQLFARYAVKNIKDEMEVIEWTFTCQNQKLAQEWMKLIDEEKNKLVSQLTGEKDAGFVHDTLIDVLARSHHRQEAPKQTILKPEEQLIKQNPLQKQQSNVFNSRLSKKEPLQKSELRHSNNAELPMNIGENSMMRNTQNQQNQSRIFMEHSQTNKIETNSAFKEKESLIKSQDPSHVSEKKGSYVDWNSKFFKNPYQGTIFEFESAAQSAFRAIWDRDSSQIREEREHKGPKGGKRIAGIRVYQSEGLRIAVSNMFSEQARQLKRQFRNYHFILESCKDRWIVGVPMSCLIEWQGTVALVKAPLPYQCLQTTLFDAMNDVRELERYTRVGNAILEKCTLWDATEVYGANEQKRLIYVDNLVQYLPQNTNQNLSKCTLRPEYMLDSVSQITPGGEIKPSNRQQFKIISTVSEGVIGCAKQLAKHLSSQQALWVDALQLKQLFHSFGVNLKYLPTVYNQVTNKQVKRYLQSVMAAKVAKDIINQICQQARIESQMNNPASLYQDCLRNFVEDSNTSSQFWKDLSIRFKKQFGIALSNSQLVGGFFLNSLIKLLRITCDAGKLDQSKKIFKEEKIVGAGFVIAVEPKSKSFYRFTGDFIEKVKYACKQQKKDQQLYSQIVNTLQLENKPIPQEYSQGSSGQCILEYLSYYTAPKNCDSNAVLQKIPIYSSIFREPPNSFVLKLTRNYLYWCVKKDRPEEFKKGIENALRISDYWLEDSHLFQCSLYELLSDFCAGQGNGEDSIKYMKESLARCIRVCGTQAKLAGAKYYELGQRQLKMGHKKQALQNFAKAKVNMQSNQNQSIKYPQLLMRLAALQLNSGTVEACIEGSLHAIRQFEEYDKRSGSGDVLTEGYKIKTFEVLSRAYEINERGEELKEMALLCAKKFNRSKSEWTFEQMLRICLAAVVYHSSLQKCQNFLRLLAKLLQQESAEEGQALRQLMTLSQGTVVMQRFIKRFQTIQRVIPEGQSKRGYSPQTKEFVLICRLLAGSVGEDYIQGLVQQKQYD